MISMVVVLPAPLGPSKPEAHALRHTLNDTPHGKGGRILLDELADSRRRAHGIRGSLA